jgi:hypothetical protein
MHEMKSVFCLVNKIVSNSFHLGFFPNIFPISYRKYHLNYFLSVQVFMFLFYHFFQVRLNLSEIYRKTCINSRPSINPRASFNSRGCEGIETIIASINSPLRHMKLNNLYVGPYEWNFTRQVPSPYLLFVFIKILHTSHIRL